jgi:hypothetical protein
MFETRGLRSASASPSARMRVRFDRARALLPVAVALALWPAASLAAPSARLFLVERVPGGVALRVDSVAVGAVAEFPIDPDSGLVDLVLPVGPGQSASLLRPSDRGGLLVVRHRGDSLYAGVRRPDGSMHERQARALADLAREETRLSITGGDGTRAAFVIRAGADARPDTAGPAANMFAGKLPFQLGDGDWVVQTETWRRPAAAAPRGRMTLSRESYLFAEVVRPDGRLGRFIVDLGAGESVVAPGFVPQGQAVVPSNMVEYSLRGARLLDYRAGDATGGMPVSAGHTLFPSLSLGGVTIDSLEAEVADLPAALGEGVVGILGIDVLRRAARVRLTVPAKADAPATLEFDPPAPLAREAGRCAFSWLSSHVVMGGEVSGLPAHWIVDSGSPVSFVDPTALAEAPWVLAARKAPPVRGVGGKPGASYDAKAPTLRVGTGARWADTPVRLARLAPFDAVRPGGRVPALLGLSEIARMGSLELDFNARLARWGPVRP